MSKKQVTKNLPLPEKNDRYKNFVKDNLIVMRL